MSNRSRDNTKYGDIRVKLSNPKTRDSVPVNECLKYYFRYGYSKEAFANKSGAVRRRAYEALGFTKKALKDPDWLVRWGAYDALGWTEEAKHDHNVRIRSHAYRTLGYTEEAKKDPDWYIRWQAYEVLGWTEEAKSDTHRTIRLYACTMFGFTEENLKDKVGTARYFAKLELDEEYRKKEVSQPNWSEECFQRMLNNGYHERFVNILRQTRANNDK